MRPFPENFVLYNNQQNLSREVFYHRKTPTLTSSALTRSLKVRGQPCLERWRVGGVRARTSGALCTRVVALGRFSIFCRSSLFELVTRNNSSIVTKVTKCNEGNFSNECLLYWQPLLSYHNSDSRIKDLLSKKGNAFMRKRARK